MKQIKTLLCVAALSTVAFGCDTPASSQENAIEVQQEAQQDLAAAQREAAEKIAEAKTEANTAVIEARDEAQREAEQAQARAVEAVDDANQDLVKARNDLRDWSQSKLETIDRNITSARSTASNKSAQVRANFEEVMREVDAQRALVQSDLSTLDTRTASGWESFKTEFEGRVDALEARLKDARARL